MEQVTQIIRMMIENFFLTVLPDVREILKERDLDLGDPLTPHVGNLVKVVTGIRRCGKTFRLYQEVLKLQNTGIPRDYICYFNFDDERLRPYPNNIISLVIETFYAMHPDARRDGAYFFFDEIQEVGSWDLSLRRIVDTEKATIYLTGSSSKLMSEDIATEFRGRSVLFELSPYSFREFARLNGAKTQGTEALYDKHNVSLLQNLFNQYLDIGGFPGVQNLDTVNRIQTLQSYVQFTVARDVVERHHFSNARYARELARTATALSARDFSINKVSNQGKSQGYTPGRDKISDLLDAFEEAHLIYGLYEYTRSVQRVRMGGFKVYSVDPGLFKAMSPASTDGQTRALETAIYLELRRRKMTGRLGEIAMLKLPSKKEVDFIWGDELLNKTYELIQVSYAIEDPKTFEREISALVEAMEACQTDQSTVITLNTEGIQNTPNGVITIVPAWKWLLM